MKKLFILLTLACSSLITGCANYARPEMISGNYYMTGDDNCRRRSNVANSDDSISCYTSDNVYVERRYPMSSQQLQTYYYQQHLQQMQAQAAADSLAAANARLSMQNQQIMQNTANIMSSGSYSQPSYNQRRVDVYHCQQVGNMVRCW